MLSRLYMLSASVEASHDNCLTVCHRIRLSMTVLQLCCPTRPLAMVMGDFASLMHCSMALHLQLQSLLCDATTPLNDHGRRMGDSKVSHLLSSSCK